MYFVKLYPKLEKKYDVKYDNCILCATEGILYICNAFIQDISNFFGSNCISSKEIVLNFFEWMWVIISGAVWLLIRWHVNSRNLKHKSFIKCQAEATFRTK